MCKCVYIFVLHTVVRLLQTKISPLQLTGSPFDCVALCAEQCISRSGCAGSMPVMSAGWGGLKKLANISFNKILLENLNGHKASEDLD